MFPTWCSNTQDWFYDLVPQVPWLSSTQLLPLTQGEHFSRNDLMSVKNGCGVGTPGCSSLGKVSASQG